MADDRERRLGENEILYRTVNQEIRKLDERFGDAPTPTQRFFCECGDVDCAERIEMTVEEYQRVRSDPTTFAIVEGHEKPEVEKVVGRTDRYAVVRKDPGQPAKLARRDSD